MQTSVALLASLATLAAADFRIYFFSENTIGDPGVGAQAYGGFKFLTNPPNCDDFINGNQIDSDFDGDVTDSQRGGATCDGCDANVNWKDWAPSRVEINDFQHNVFNGEPYHITLYGTGNGGYNIHDTDDNVVGSCQMAEEPQEVECGSAWGPYLGLEFVTCTTDITVQ